MNNNAKSLAQRRTELVAQCAREREDLALEVAALRSPFSIGALQERLGGNRKLLLAAAGVGIGLLAMRPKRLLALASRALPLLGAVRRFLPLLPR
jgi:hypothetical protein